MIVDPVTEDEVFERLRADLARQGVCLHRGPLDGMAHNETGRFYTTREGSDVIAERNVELDRWARRHGVLKPNEALVPSKGEVER